jgi:hypothetical protein
VLFYDEAGQYRHGDADQVEAEHDILPADGEEGRGEQGVHRQPRPAGHEGVHDDGQDALHSARRRRVCLAEKAVLLWSA